MKGTTFKYTNKQYFLGCFKWFFTILFFFAFIYILSDLGSFLETHALETVILILVAAGTLFMFFSGGKGKELKSDVYLSGKSVIFGGKLRIPLEELELIEYHSTDRNTLHLLHDKSKSFVLYTNQPDAFIEQLKQTSVTKRSYSYSEYKFSRDSVVWVGAEGGRELAINLDTGNYSTLEEGEVQEFEPEKFIIAPVYVKKA